MRVGGGEVEDCAPGHVEEERTTPIPVVVGGERYSSLKNARVCVECGERGHFDCGLQDPAVREAAPTYAAIAALGWLGEEE